LGPARRDGGDVVAELSAHQIDRPRSTNREPSQVRYIESADTVPDRHVLGQDALVLDGHRPATEVREPSAEAFVAGIER
jgi:hypothetical protein